ncbi:TPA: Ger(x)C family spore germination protein, partial [Clostridioides difficile]
MKKVGLIVFIILAIFLTGCWDMVEINQRLFVSSIGVDLNKENGMNKYTVTYVYPNINAIGKNANESTKKFIVSTPCSSLFQAGKEFSTNVEFPFYYKHLKVLVIGEDIAKDEKLMRQVIDELNRDTKINKKLQIIIAEGKAKDILEARPTQGPIVDGTIYNILKDNKSASRFTPQSLTGLIMEFDCNGVSLVPKVSKKGRELAIAGGAILKNYEFIGWIGEKENRALSLIKDKVKIELIDLPYKDGMLSYSITDINSNKEVTINKEIKVKLSINIEGYLQGYIMDEKMTVYDVDILKDMEKSIEKQIKKEIEETINLVQ